MELSEIIASLGVIRENVTALQRQVNNLAYKVGEIVVNGDTILARRVDTLERSIDTAREDIKDLERKLP